MLRYIFFNMKREGVVNDYKLIHIRGSTMKNIQLAFERFAEQEAKGKSPLYAYWCQHIVDDEPLLRLLSHIPETQPKPNLFFAETERSHLPTYLSTLKK